jgi:hypothetical protein
MLKAKFGGMLLASILATTGLLAACSSTNEVGDDESDITTEDNLIDALVKKGSAPNYQVWRALRDGKQKLIDQYVADNKDDFASFKNTPVGKSGVPMIMLRLMPELFPEIWGAPSESMERVGFSKDTIEPNRVLPLGLGYIASDTIVPTPVGNVAINVATLTCAGCHDGRVQQSDGSIKHILGAPNTRFDGFRQAVLRSVTHPAYTADAFRAKLAEKPMGFVYGDPAMGQQEAMERAVFMSPGAAENFLAQLKTKALAGATRMAQTLGAHTYAGQMDRLSSYKPGYLDAISVGVIPLFDPAVMTQEQLKSSLPPAPAEIDITSVWNQNVRPLAQWDGSIKNRTYRNLAAEVGVIQNPALVNMDNANRTTRFTEKLPSAPYPFDIDAAKAARGLVLFTQNCASCHSYLPEVQRTSRDLARNSALFAASDVGTDPNRATLLTPAMTNGLLGLLKAACTDEATCSGLTDAEILSPTGKYLSPPLDGIWARAPYLHNGSVPNLRALLIPSLRPTKFYRGNLAYDQANVGFVNAAGAGTGEYDTTLSGNSNRGHDTKEYLGRVNWAREPGKVADLLEFMKAL